MEGEDGWVGECWLLAGAAAGAPPQVEGLRRGVVSFPRF